MFYFSSKAATLVSRVPCGSLARVLRSLDVKKKRAARSLMCYHLIMIFVIVFLFYSCQGHQCQNGATCEDGITQYTCKCSAGFEGQLCRNNTDDCVSAVCLNNATCLDHIANYTCNCSLGFTGEQNIILY